VRWLIVCWEGCSGARRRLPRSGRRARLAAGAEAFAAALAEDQAKHDPAVAKAAERFLDRQSLLLDA
jgi:hypothetical protein